MSTLSQRLARLRESGKMPAAGSVSPSGKPVPHTSQPDTGGSGATGTTGATGDSPDRDRLAALRQRDHRRPAVPDRPEPSPTIAADDRPPGEGWIRQADFLWERTLEAPAPLPDRISDPFVLPEGLSSGKLLFYDLETTGLSGGAGNTAFLIGLGRQQGPVFRVTQLFLADYPGEEALLRRYAELAEDDPQVSFNGRSFDSQVLKTRFLLNRMPPIRPLQIDLLYPARRLWKGVLENQTLRTLEEKVLDFHRTDDLPGSEAPDAWFEWLSGKPERIEGVFRHNADDIVSLARLAAKIEHWGGTVTDSTAGAPAGAPVSCWGMAVQWSGRSPEREREWLEKGWLSGERRCGLELAVRYRRSGRLPEARIIWESLNSEGTDTTAAVELAKFWEHREHNPSRALEILQPLTGMPLNEADRRSLLHRMARLKVKIISLEQK